MEALKVIDYDDDYFQEEEQEEKERFIVDSLEKASWAMRKLKEIEEDDNRIDELAELEIRKITSWKEKAKKSNENSKNYFEGLLIEYVDKETRKDDKFELNTPYGKASKKKQRPEIKYDEEKLIIWLKERNYTQFVRLKEEPAKNDIKKAFTLVGDSYVDENGEIVDGIELVKRPDVVDIRLEI